MKSACENEIKMIKQALEDWENGAPQNIMIEDLCEFCCFGHNANICGWCDDRLDESKRIEIR